MIKNCRCIYREQELRIGNILKNQTIKVYEGVI